MVGNRLANKVIRDQTSRRIFFAALFLVLCLSLLIQAFVLPNVVDPETVGFVLLDNLLLTLGISVVTTLGTSILVIWFTPEVLQDSSAEVQLEDDEITRISNLVVDEVRSAEKAEITIIPHEKIEETVVSAAQDSTVYKYHGHLGRFPSGVVIPTLINNSRQDLTSRDVQLLVMDPSSKACESFVEYKNRAESFDSNTNSDENQHTQTWSVERIRNEIMGTIVSTYIYDSKTLINADISLVPNASLFRVELFDDAVIITRENPHMPAMQVSNESDHYDAYKSDLWLAENYGMHLPDIPSDDVPTWDELDADQAESLLEKVIHDIDDNDQFVSMVERMSMDDWKTVIKTIKHNNEPTRKFPYENPLKTDS